MDGAPLSWYWVSMGGKKVKRVGQRVNTSQALLVGQAVCSLKPPTALPCVNPALQSPSLGLGEAQQTAKASREFAEHLDF